jgi:hypothetical protein
MMRRLHPPLYKGVNPIINLACKWTSDAICKAADWVENRNKNLLAMDGSGIKQVLKRKIR